MSHSALSRSQKSPLSVLPFLWQTLQLKNVTNNCYNNWISSVFKNQNMCKLEDTKLVLFLRITQSRILELGNQGINFITINLLINSNHFITTGQLISSTQIKIESKLLFNITTQPLAKRLSKILTLEGCISSLNNIQVRYCVWLPKK